MSILYNPTVALNSKLTLCLVLQVLSQHGRSAHSEAGSVEPRRRLTPRAANSRSPLAPAFTSTLHLNMRTARAWEAGGPVHRAQGTLPTPQLTCCWRGWVRASQGGNLRFKFTAHTHNSGAVSTVGDQWAWGSSHLVLPNWCSKKRGGPC